MTDKFCKDCKWCFNRNQNGPLAWHCMRIEARKKDLLTGDVVTPLCAHMRADPNDLNKWHIGNPHCGPEGILFEPKQ